MSNNGTIYDVTIATMIFSCVKISCFRTKANLVFHWCLYNFYTIEDSLIQVEFAQPSGKIINDSIIIQTSRSVNLTSNFFRMSFLSSWKHLITIIIIN